MSARCVKKPLPTKDEWFMLRLEGHERTGFGCLIIHRRRFPSHVVLAHKDPIVDGQAKQRKQ